MKRPFILIFTIVLILSVFRIIQYKPSSLDSYFEEKADITCSGTIERIIEKNSSTAVYLKDIKIKSIQGNSITEDSYGVQKILLYSNDTSCLHVKNQISISGTIQKFTNGTNPGQFNELLYYKSLHVDYKLFSKQITLLCDTRSYYSDLLRSIRSHMKDIYHKFLSEQDAGIMSAMLLGEKSGLPKETKELYQKNGISHILAISGVKTLKLDIPLVPETRIKWAFVPLHIAIIYILKLCLDEEIIPRCRFPCSRGYHKKHINWQKKQ